MTVKKKISAAVEPALFEVSQSVISCWRRCHMRYHYRYVQLLERKKPIVYFQVGQMIGQCLDAIAVKRNHKKAPHWSTVLEKFKKQWGRLWDEEKEYYGDPISTVRRIVERYERIYADDGLIYLNGRDGLPYELSGQVELSPGIVFTFHIDKMPKDRHGRVWIMDHKAYKNIPDAEDRFSALQLVFYYKVAPMAGYPKPTGVLWDYLRKKPPTIPKQLKNGTLTQRDNLDTDYETYLGEVKRLKLPEKDYAAYLKDLKARGHMDFYQRTQLPGPSAGLVENVWNDAVTSAIQIKEMGKASKVRSIDKTCKQCEYFSLCQVEYRGMDAEFIRKTEYQKQKEVRHDHSRDDE